MLYTVLLNPAIDVRYQLDELAPGSTRLDVPAQVFPAGKALNVARVIRTLGEDVCVLGIIPRDGRRQFSDYCDKLGIASDFHTVEGYVRINATIIEESIGQVTHLNSAGRHLPPRVQGEMLALMQKHLRAGDTWALCGSLPEGFESDGYRKMIQECHKKKASVLLDSRGRELKMGIRAKPEMVKPNLTELESYFGEPIKGVHHIVLRAKKLLDLGISYVFVSLGADGMIAVHDNDCLLCSAPAVKVVDTVGCGDALVAGLLVGKGRHFSFPEMCRLAIACGVSKAMHPGPGSVGIDEVWRLMEDVKIENA